MKTEKIAIPVLDKRVSPLFDTSERFKIVEINDDLETDRYFLTVNMSRGLSEFDNLTQAGIDTIICSAISKQYANCVRSTGIELISGVIGSTDEIIKAYCENRLEAEEFAMPGSRWRERCKGRSKGKNSKKCLRNKRNNNQE